MASLAGKIATGHPPTNKEKKAALEMPALFPVASTTGKADNNNKIIINIVSIMRLKIR